MTGLVPTIPLEPLEFMVSPLMPFCGVSPAVCLSVLIPTVPDDTKSPSLKKLYDKINTLLEGFEEVSQIYNETQIATFK